MTTETAVLLSAQTAMTAPDTTPATNLDHVEIGTILHRSVHRGTERYRVTDQTRTSWIAHEIDMAGELLYGMSRGVKIDKSTLLIRGSERCPRFHTGARAKYDNEVTHLRDTIKAAVGGASLDALRAAAAALGI